MSGQAIYEAKLAALAAERDAHGGQLPEALEVERIAELERVWATLTDAEQAHVEAANEIAMAARLLGRPLGAEGPSR